MGVLCRKYRIRQNPDEIQAYCSHRHKPMTSPTTREHLIGVSAVRDMDMLPAKQTAHESYGRVDNKNGA